MKLQFAMFVCLGALAAGANAQVRVNAVLNAASYGLPGMPNEGVAQGSIATAFGTGLGVAGLKQVSALPLGTTWEGLSVRITVGGTTVNAFPIQQYNGTQVSFVVPSNTPVGDGTVTITFNGQASNAAPIKIVARNFGVFSINSAGSGPGVFTDPLAGDVPNLLNRSSRPNQLMDIWGTGIGAVVGNEAAMALPGDMANVPVEVWVGGRRANIIYRGRSGCCVGVDQIRFEVPSGVTGCYVPVVVVVGTGATAVASNYTTISIAPNGGTCSDAALGGLSSDLINSIANGGELNIGSINLNRSSSSFSFGGQTFSSETDSGAAIFFRYDYGRLIRSSNAAGGITPFGSCLVSVYQGSTEPPDVAQPIPLDAGPTINVSGPKGAKQLTKTNNAPGVYSAVLGGGTPFPGGPPVEPLYLDPGAYTFTGSGGAQVGAFTANMNVPAFVQWTNQGSISTVNRASGQLITWSGGDPNALVYISGSSFAGTADNPSVASFVCYERASVGQFTIPAPVLLSLPRTGTGAEAFPGSLGVGSYTTPATFTAPGLNIGYMSAGSSTGKSVTYQ